MLEEIEHFQNTSYNLKNIHNLLNRWNYKNFYKIVPTIFSIDVIVEIALIKRIFSK